MISAWIGSFVCFLFATTAIFASVVIYDASDIRLHAGNQAEVLNQIVSELPSEHPLSERRPLREFLDNTPTQICSIKNNSRVFTVQSKCQSFYSWLYEFICRQRRRKTSRVILQG